jgi:hypothetical protein
MNVAIPVKDFKEAFEFTPVNGRANDYVIHSMIPPHNGHAEIEMSPADWDKFEKDIEDAFERVT